VSCEKSNNPGLPLVFFEVQKQAGMSEIGFGTAQVVCMSEICTLPASLLKSINIRTMTQQYLGRF
jgi:hypothetical protein